MKLLLSFIVISVANAASQNSGLIRGSSSIDDSADTMAAATATHMVPGDIFAGLLSNSWTPQEYCPTGSQYNPNGPQWPREDGCYPGTGSIPAGHPKCCDKGNCPNSGRPLCENSGAAKPAYCADLGPNPSCYQQSWPQCCVATNGPSCPSTPPPCDTSGNRRTCNNSNVCYSDEFCLKQSCSQPGQCVVMPDKCPTNYDPVCGCDNKTYSNACAASVQGRTTVNFHGECNGNGGDRRTCNDSNVCYSDEFCLKQSCSQPGQCVVMPDKCPTNYDPVCGCDNKTYSNACAASVQGRTTVNFYGECNGGNRNTCNRNTDCQSDQYCKFPDGDCNNSGRGGVCTSIPTGADCNGYPNNKVCGCDNVEYKNSCKANQSSTSIQNTGNCGNEELAFE